MRRLLLPYLSVCLLAQAPDVVATRCVKKVLPLPGVNLHFTDRGEGEAVLLLSGGPGFSSSYMEPVAQLLLKERRVILPDQRGTGLSKLDSYAPEVLNLDRCVQDMEDLRRNLKVEHWIVVGHSWGGMLGMAYATKHPEAVRALVLVESGGPDLDFIVPFDQKVQARLSAEDRARLAYWRRPEIQEKDGERAEFEDLKAELNAYFYDRSKAHTLVQGMHVGRETFDGETYQSMIGELEKVHYDLRPALASLHIPALVVQGRQDPIGTAEEIQKSLPGSRLDWIEHCGHFPWIEQPEAFRRSLESFLSKLGSAPAPGPRP